MISHIKDLKKKQLSIKGYNSLVWLVSHFISKYNWPKQILEEAENRTSDWNKEDIIQFTHQFIAFVYEKDKLKNIEKIPDNYLEYYFHQIIVTYVASRVRTAQMKMGISYDAVRRILKDELPSKYKKIKKDGKLYWGKREERDNERFLPSTEIENIISYLPKIKPKVDSKQYKPNVMKALNRIIDNTDSFIEEDLLIKITYGLIDSRPYDELINNEIYIEEDIIEEQKINSAITIIKDQLQYNEIPLLIDYFFINQDISVRDLSKKYDIPKSTIHHRLDKFKRLLNENYQPASEKEGLYFLEKLHKLLDSIE